MPVRRRLIGSSAIALPVPSSPLLLDRRLGPASRRAPRVGSGRRGARPACSASAVASPASAPSVVSAVPSLRRLCRLRGAPDAAPSPPSPLPPPVGRPTGLLRLHRFCRLRRLCHLRRAPGSFPGRPATLPLLCPSSLPRLRCLHRLRSAPGSSRSRSGLPCRAGVCPPPSPPPPSGTWVAADASCYTSALPQLRACPARGSLRVKRTAAG
ncbi:hypothetical protein BS78_05G137600 [Paspalum vaginatum]|nr:hypothetical protein BS78_05G137600 [Paspalum vaginatum]